MADLIAREFEAIFRCHNELMKNSNVSAASLNRVALIFQVSVQTVQKVLAEKKSGKPYQPALKSGRKAVVEFSFKQELNYLMFTKIKKNEHVTISDIHKHATECLDVEQPYIR
jgi:hypothetical protein